VSDEVSMPREKFQKIIAMINNALADIRQFREEIKGKS